MKWSWPAFVTEYAMELPPIAWPWGAVNMMEQWFAEVAGLTATEEVMIKQPPSGK